MAGRRSLRVGMPDANRRASPPSGFGDALPRRVLPSQVKAHRPADLMAPKFRCERTQAGARRTSGRQKRTATCSAQAHNSFAKFLACLTSHTDGSHASSPVTDPGHGQRLAARSRVTRHIEWRPHTYAAPRDGRLTRHACGAVEVVVVSRQRS